MTPSPQDRPPLATETADRLVICGVDDSDVARRAAHVAAELARDLNARLVLLHVAQVGNPPAGSAFAYEKLKDQALARAWRLVEELKEAIDGTGAEGQVAVGSPGRQLIEAAGSQGADLVVVGSRGRGPLKAAVLGSVSGDVVTSAPCPVVVIPPAAA